MLLLLLQDTQRRTLVHLNTNKDVWEKGGGVISGEMNVPSVALRYCLFMSALNKKGRGVYLRTSFRGQNCCQRRKSISIKETTLQTKCGRTSWFFTPLMVTDQCISHKLNSDSSVKTSFAPLEGASNQGLTAPNPSEMVSWTTALNEQMWLLSHFTAGGNRVWMHDGATIGDVKRFFFLIIRSPIKPSTTQTCCMLGEFEPMFPYKELFWILNLFTEEFFGGWDRITLWKTKVLFLYLSQKLEKNKK